MKGGIETDGARRLIGSSGSALLGDLSTLTDGHVLTVQADGTIQPEAAAASGVGGSTGATDNAILRADGTGGATVQSSGITVADAASGVAEMSSARLVRGVRTISSSPDTQLVSDDLLYFSGSVEVDLLTSCTTGREFEYACTSAGTLSLDPGSTDTINGATDTLAIVCTPGQSVRVARSATGAWRAVLLGSVGSPSVCFRAYVVGGTVTGVLEVLAGGSWVTAKSLGTASRTAGTAAIGSSASGDGFALPSGYATAADAVSEGDRWIFDLAAAGVTWTPGANSYFVITYTGNQPTGSATHYVVGGYCGHTTPGSGAGLFVGYGRAASTLQVIGGVNDGSTTAGTCTGTAPAQGVLSWIGSASAYAAEVRGRAASSMPTASVSDPAGQTVGTLGFGFVTLRRALAGGDATVTGAEVRVYPAPGEVTW